MTVGALAPGSNGPAAAAPAPKAPFVALRGGGAWTPYQSLVTWQNELGTAASPIDLGYTPHGTLLGRDDFLSGVTDFVVTGVPFTEPELTIAKRKESDFIKVPMVVGSLAVLLHAPEKPTFSVVTLLCDPYDPNTPDPDACVVVSPFTNPTWRVPHDNLAAMLLEYFGTDPNTLTPTAPALPWRAWNHPSVLRALGVPANATLATKTADSTPDVIGRSDPDEANYFLQQYVARFAPHIWGLVKAADSRIPWDDKSERLGRAPSESRDGVTQQASILGLSADSRGGNSMGRMVYAPPSARVELQRGFPKQPISFVQIKNGHGDWVAPTPDAINKAVDAGLDAPLFAFDHDVPGAYPLAWVDDLYAPAHGLNAYKTEGLAMLIRYLATAGQAAPGKVGEGRLPAPLVTQALAGADALVRSNCTGSDRVLETSSDPGPLAPPGDALAHIGSMLHCRPLTPPPSGPTGFGSSGGSGSAAGPFGSDGGDGGLGSSSDYSGGGGIGSSGSTSADGTDSQTGGASTDGDATSATPGAGKPVVLTASKLPLPLPGEGKGLDRLGAFVLGVLLYLLLRKPTSRMLRRVFL